MSEIRKSASQPQGPAFETKAKPAIVAKPAAPAKAPKAKPVPARTNAKGQPLRCEVRLGTVQCHNPARHEIAKRFTCSTHRLSHLRGAKLAFVTKRGAIFVDPSKAAKAS